MYSDLGISWLIQGFGNGKETKKFTVAGSVR